MNKLQEILCSLENVLQFYEILENIVIRKLLRIRYMIWNLLVELLFRSNKPRVY